MCPMESFWRMCSQAPWRQVFFLFEGILGQPQGPNLIALLALTTPQKVLSIWRLVKLKTLDFSDLTRTGITILTSAADYGA